MNLTRSIRRARGTRELDTVDLLLVFPELLIMYTAIGWVGMFLRFFGLIIFFAFEVNEC
jgi:hypothetical protein